MIDLAGRRVTVVEDSYLLAIELKYALEEAGAEVLGPFGRSDKALASFQHHVPHCAVLDVSLGEETSFGLARVLQSRGVPFLFFTGYDGEALPPEFAGVERLEKPVDTARLLQAVERCCQTRPPLTGA